jgi:hypothetical protein
MNEQTPKDQPAAQEAIAQATAPEPEFNPHEAVDAFFSSIQRTPSMNKITSLEREHPVSPIESNANVVNTTAQETSLDEQTPAPSASPEELQKKLKTADKRYNDLQSDIDRRINAATKALNEKLEFVTAALTRLNQPQPPQTEEYLEAQQREAQAMQLQHLIDQRVSAQINADPRVQAGSVIGDWAKFRSDRPDSYKYDPLIQRSLDKFPPQSGKLYEHLINIYDFWDGLASEMANGQGEAARNLQPQPTSAPGAGYGKVTSEQAAQLAAKARAYQQETGLSATNTAKPVIDTRAPLNTAVDQMADAWTKKFFGG